MAMPATYKGPAGAGLAMQHLEQVESSVEVFYMVPMVHT